MTREPPDKRPPDPTDGEAAPTHEPLPARDAALLGGAAPDAGERARAEALRAALDDPDAPRPKSAEETQAELESNLRVAMFVAEAQLREQALAPVRQAEDRLRATLARARAQLDTGPHSAAGRRRRRNTRLVLAAIAASAILVAVLPVLLRPAAPSGRDARSYAAVFTTPFPPGARALERVDRMIAWRKGAR